MNPVIAINSILLSAADSSSLTWFDKYMYGFRTWIENWFVRFSTNSWQIRVSDKYEYITKTIEIADKQYNVHFAVGHTPGGIEIVIGTASCAKALKAARETYDDGLTFEVHTYVKPSITPEQVWAMVKKTKCPQTSLSLWTYGAPEWKSAKDDVKTHIYGQITSAYYPGDLTYFEYSVQK